MIPSGIFLESKQKYIHFYKKKDFHYDTREHRSKVS